MAPRHNLALEIAYAAVMAGNFALHALVFGGLALGLACLAGGC